MADVAYAYEARFYDWLETAIIRSADIILPLVRDDLSPTSVLDVGCGRGLWLRAWEDLGITDYHGIDGEDAVESGLEIPADHFTLHDLRKPLYLGRRFDLLQSMEIAEHLPTTSADNYIDFMTLHSDRILFSAAIPGQGGENHINEQPLDYWRAKFAARGYIAFDPYRATLQANHSVAAYYRYNTLLYVRENVLDDLPISILMTRLPSKQSLAIKTPFSWRLRTWFLSNLPPSFVTRLVRMRYRFITP